jgi:thiol-disulfide isomerase/thioredoxin
MLGDPATVSPAPRPEKTHETLRRRRRTVVVRFAVVRAGRPEGPGSARTRVRPPRGHGIQQEQRDKLAAWLQQRDGKDLGDFGYAKALQHYRDRDYDSAVASLDAFFQQGHKIASAELGTMAGRIFLNAVAQQVRAAQPDMDRLARWSAGMTRLYQDTAMLERMAKTLVTKVPDAATVRVALAKGVFGSDLTVAQKDAFLQSLYQGGGTAVAARPTAASAPAGAAVDQGKVVQPGQAVGAFAIDRVVNGPEKFDLDACKGKVVVLDLLASWCGPCRAAVPTSVQLQKDHPDDLQVVGVTRYYGRGMDFAGDDAKVPHGGRSVADIGRAQEVALYAPLVKAFGINYPIVFCSDQKLAQQRFGVQGIPTLYVIGRDGKVVGSVVGAGDEQHATLLQLIEQARNQDLARDAAGCRAVSRPIPARSMIFPRATRHPPVPGPLVRLQSRRGRGPWSCPGRRSPGGGARRHGPRARRALRTRWTAQLPLRRAGAGSGGALAFRVRGSGQGALVRRRPRLAGRLLGHASIRRLPTAAGVTADGVLRRWPAARHLLARGRDRAAGSGPMGGVVGRRGLAARWGRCAAPAGGSPLTDRLAARCLSRPWRGETIDDHRGHPR